MRFFRLCGIKSIGKRICGIWRIHRHRHYFFNGFKISLIRRFVIFPAIERIVNEYGDFFDRIQRLFFNFVICGDNCTRIFRCFSREMTMRTGDLISCFMACGFVHSNVIIHKFLSTLRTKQNIAPNRIIDFSPVIAVVSGFVRPSKIFPQPFQNGFCLF